MKKVKSGWSESRAAKSWSLSTMFVRSFVRSSVRSFKSIDQFSLYLLTIERQQKTFEQIKGSWRRESNSKSWTSSLMFLPTYLPTYQAHCWPREQEFKIWRELLLTVGGSHHGLAVMGGDSWSEGCGFESQHRKLDGHIFTYIYCINCNVCLKRRK